jgi:hypothetical protein
VSTLDCGVAATLLDRSKHKVHALGAKGNECRFGVAAPFGVQPPSTGKNANDNIVLRGGQRTLSAEALELAVRHPVLFRDPQLGFEGERPPSVFRDEVEGVMRPERRYGCPGLASRPTLRTSYDPAFPSGRVRPTDRRGSGP